MGEALGQRSIVSKLEKYDIFMKSVSEALQNAIFYGKIWLSLQRNEIKLINVLMLALFFTKPMDYPIKCRVWGRIIWFRVIITLGVNPMYHMSIFDLQ